MSMEFRAASAPRLLSLLVASLLSAGVMAQTTTTDTSAAALGLSDYRHFVIYPHLEKALKAQKANDEKPRWASSSIFISRRRITSR